METTISRMIRRFRESAPTSPGHRRKMKDSGKIDPFWWQGEESSGGDHRGLDDSLAASASSFDDSGMWDKENRAAARYRVRRSVDAVDDETDEEFNVWGERKVHQSVEKQKQRQPLSSTAASIRDSMDQVQRSLGGNGAADLLGASLSAAVPRAADAGSDAALASKQPKQKDPTLRSMAKSEADATKAVRSSFNFGKQLPSRLDSLRESLADSIYSSDAALAQKNVEQQRTNAAHYRAMKGAHPHSHEYASSGGGGSSGTYDPYAPPMHQQHQQHQYRQQHQQHYAQQSAPHHDSYSAHNPSYPSYPPYSQQQMHLQQMHPQQMHPQHSRGEPVPLRVVQRGLDRAQYDAYDAGGLHQHQHQPYGAPPPLSQFGVAPLHLPHPHLDAYGAALPVGAGSGLAPLGHYGAPPPMMMPMQGYGAGAPYGYGSAYDPQAGAPYSGGAPGGAYGAVYGVAYGAAAHPARRHPYQHPRHANTEDIVSGLDRAMATFTTRVGGVAEPPSVSVGAEAPKTPERTRPPFEASLAAAEDKVDGDVAGQAANLERYALSALRRRHAERAAASVHRGTTPVAPQGATPRYTSSASPAVLAARGHAATPLSLPMPLMPAAMPLASPSYSVALRRTPVRQNGALRLPFAPSPAAARSSYAANANATATTAMQQQLQLQQQQQQLALHRPLAFEQQQRAGGAAATLLTTAGMMVSSNPFGAPPASWTTSMATPGRAALGQRRVAASPNPFVARTGFSPAPRSLGMPSFFEASGSLGPPPLSSREQARTESAAAQREVDRMLRGGGGGAADERAAPFPPAAAPVRVQAQMKAPKSPSQSALAKQMEALRAQSKRLESALADC